MQKRVSSKKRKKVVMVSGGFDPVHIGHVRMFQEAKKLGDELVVVINNDNWKRKKRRHVFMPDIERKEIIKAFACVDRVVLTGHSKNLKTPKDMSVSKELLKIKPDIFANGGDRNEEDSKNPNSSLYYEVDVCKKLGIKMVYNVGRGGKIRSSSELLKKYSKKHSKK
ncbi:MAG TPA: adenylyltransferase/cytidyltransferase family protein [Candidatus Paceibacterota bacterium]|jgi:D-beta-D-heptose 7-phosphate kinase/D-beta-D-heptose 1-phosphate adenosyltransferase|nr:adenylyltransferase/cytidyltransferase family protein [Candidatus Paceibacterota bacterium]